MTECPITLRHNNIMVGNSSGYGADVPMSGAVAIDDTGATTSTDAFGITIGAGVLYLGAIAEGWACARTQDPSRS